MLKNIFKTALRSFRKNLSISLINVIGLGVGLATCILLLLYIWDESSYDKHHRDLDNLYRVAINFPDGRSASSPAPMAFAMKSAFPEVLQSARLLKYPMLETMILNYEDKGGLKIFNETNGYYVDSTFFDVLTYEFVSGNPKTALSENNTMVLSKTLAVKIFGEKNPINEVITIGLPEGNFDYTVKGVFVDSPKSHIRANFFLSIINSDIGNWVSSETSWPNNNMFHTYFRLQEGKTIDEMESKMQDFYQSKLEESASVGVTLSLFLQPVQDIYLKSDLGYEVDINGNYRNLFVFGSIGFFVLLIACINFMNLSTARSEKRAKEVGVRKVIGAGKYELVKQFMGESILMSIISLFLAFLLLLLLLPMFNNVAEKSLDLFGNPLLFPIILGLTLLTGVMAGIYPAFYLSGFKPVAILKGSKGNGFAAVSIRKGLVVFQFVISIALIAMAFIIQGQMSFLVDSNLGFDKEQQLIVPLQSEESRANFAAFKTQLESQQGIRMVSGGSSYPGLKILQDWLLYSEGKTVDDVVDVYINRVSNDFFEVLDLELLAGRGYTEEFTENSGRLVINETAAKAYGFEVEDAVGKILNMDWRGEVVPWEIIGVVRDFHFESLHTNIRPLAFPYTGQPPFLVAKIETDRMADLISFVEQTWKSVNPATPFAYSFLDQDFMRNYESEKRTSTIILYFTIIAILISCIGLFGLAAFTAEQKTKEIGIRKVLGATTWNITTLVSKEFLVLVMVAILIAAPLGYFAAEKWLENFAYKIDLSIWVFVISGLVAILIAYGTVSFQAVRAALANPVDSLKSE
ncbi:ABC transporter permease [Aquiflexum sp.]|uniref:ABC transporter permease n=1 Tax=Aquiflexum sp. TaxID=1872584 RepID=UPI003592FB95